MNITRKQLTEVLAEIPVGACVLISGHTRADGDSIGSVLALTRAFELRGIQAIPLLADNATPPAPYLWMAGCEKFTRPEELLPESAQSESPSNFAADVFIALDTPDFGRLNKAGELLRQSNKSIIIDHHPPLKESYADLRYTQVEAAATGELIWALLGEMNWQRDEAIATACYVSTLSDTGSFQFSNTSKETFAYTSEMIEAGAQPAKIAQQLYGQKPLAALHLEGRILSRAKLLNGGAVVHSYLSDADLQELGVPVDYTENLIDLIRCVQDTDVALFITQSSKGPRLSLRSDGKFDVSAVAQRFGGGGHKPAAGITWPDKTATKEQILDELLPHLPQGEEGAEMASCQKDWKLVSLPVTEDDTLEI
ncbi:MAG: bifunctional oligoribonuclease/PAP phosphatase NrnA [Coriobacteriia bacterium]|nr:bifunctional oligoribonuclease/PAP phosphatase NrnA [Coriobacteriia bacterium]